jgi:Ni,Fe-hydrogenase maturation factor
MKRTLILGLGNPLQGDDGVGCRIAEDVATV